jgi:hypothetical protein
MEIEFDLRNIVLKYKQGSVLDKNRTMNNIQKHNTCMAFIIFPPRHCYLGCRIKEGEMGGSCSTLKEVMTIMYAIIMECIGTVVVKSSFIWEITSYCVLDVNRRSGGTWLHFQVRRINKQETSMKEVTSSVTDYTL